MICWFVFTHLKASSGASGKQPPCQCRRCKRRRFSPWVGKIHWRRAWLHVLYTTVFLPGESQGQRILAATVLRVTKSQTQLKWLSMHAYTFTICLDHVLFILQISSFDGDLKKNLFILNVINNNVGFMSTSLVFIF